MLRFDLVSCDLCGGTSCDTVMRIDAGLPDQPDAMSLVRCRACGLKYQNPRPTPETLHLCYPDDYGPYHDPPSPPAAASPSSLSRQISDIREGIARRNFGIDSPGSDENVNGLLRGLITLHARYLRSPLFPDAVGERRLLDIGCGTGRFLGRMTAKGWIADGLESHPAAAAIAQQQTRGRVTVGLEEDIAIPDGTYDLVMMSHVLEHVPSPTATMRRIQSMLKPGGWFVAIVPNIDGTAAAIFGESWIAIDLPRHLFHFSPQTLGRVIESSGLVVRELGTRVDPPIWTNTVKARRGRGFDRAPLDGPAHKMMQWLLAPLAHVGRGDIVFVRAQKLD